MARVLVGVTGGIAAYKACELVRLLVKDGHEVTPILTPDAERFVAAHTFEALARREAARDLYPHLVDADLLVIAPLSANTLAKLAHGLADNVLTQAALAVRGARARRAGDERPHVGAPGDAGQPAAPGRARRPRDRPRGGELAEGEHGVGRMSEPEAIFARCLELLGRGRAAAREAGRRQRGGDARAARLRPLRRQPLVREDGRRGRARGAPARRRGHARRLEPRRPRPGRRRGRAGARAADLAREVLARDDADVVVMAAAVADYRPAEPAAGKRPKDAETWTIDLEPTEDVLAELGRRRRNGQILVGFAADEGEDGPRAGAHEIDKQAREPLRLQRRISF